METPALLNELSKDTAPPERFTWPFCYEPHPLCVAAAEHLQARLAANDEWKEEIEQGKMFGVLVVSDANGDIGYLAAYSGQLCGRNDLPGFVPAVYDLLQPDGYFKTHETEITAINKEIERIENDTELTAWRQRLNEINLTASEDIEGYKAKMAEAKTRRDKARADGCADNKALTKESQYMKAELHRKKKAHAEQISECERHIIIYEQRIADLRQQRRQMSDALQHWIFSMFKMRNALGEEKDLNDIFSEYRQTTGSGSATPPSGSGECCAPKLLQYAYINGYKPLCMAEFWYGMSPKAEIRHHLHYYPSCQSKCKPILSFMLRGLDVDPDPLATAGTTCSKPEVIYDDDYICVINKPSGMLSVPGTTAQPAATDIMDMLPVHRLDMDTSGLLMLAKTEEAQRIFRSMFERRQIKKRYTALLSRTIDSDEGEISLPLSPDINDRPRQKVDHSDGKEALTHYKVISRSGEKTLVHLYPHTGRTHQLRVHCAHRDGLDAPIIGDRLYGKSADRLHLHADTLEFYHPILKRQITVSKPIDYNKER